jgi:hypothetical protein
MTSETVLVRAIIEALALKGYWLWRVNSGATILGRGTSSERFLKGAPKGSPDIFCVLPGGRLCGIEAKSPTGRQNPNQKAWEQKAAKHGVAYVVARSVSEALAFVERERAT